MPCLVKNEEEEEIDLSVLRNYKFNYKVKLNVTSHFLLNVCKSLWYGKKQMCTVGSGACLVSQNKYLPLGYVDKGFLKYQKGIVSLMYNSDIICAEASYVKVNITFLCGSGFGVSTVYSFYSNV